MGWLHEDAPGHEGYLVAVVRDVELGLDGMTVLRSRWRELSGLVHDEEAQRKYDGQSIEVVHVACECGWRSMRLSAPRGTTWRPLVVWLPVEDEEAFEALALELWTAHVREHGSANLLDCEPGPVAATTQFRETHGRVERLGAFEIARRTR